MTISRTYTPSSSAPRNTLLDAALEEPCSRLTRIASALIDAPVAAICLELGGPAIVRGIVPGNGTEASAFEFTPFWRELATRMRECRSATALPDMRKIPQSLRIRLNPPAHSRAFLGAPLFDQNRQYLGAIWVGDHRPREWNVNDVEHLEDLAASASAEIGFRLRELGRSSRMARGELASSSELARRVAEAWSRMESSDEPADGSHGATPAIVDELHTALEELRVSSEELQILNEELRASQYVVEQERAYYRELFDCVPYAYVMTTSDGMIQEANAAAGELLGYRAGALTGKPLAVFVGGASQKDFRARLRQLSAGGRLEWQVQVAAKGGPDRTVTCAASARASSESGAARIYWLFREREVETSAPMPEPRAPRGGSRADHGAGTDPTRDPATPDFEELIARMQRDPSVPLATQLREVIANGVHMGSLHVGQRLPSIRVMADIYGVTSYAALQAYSTLEAEGVVERRERSGIYVAAMDRPVSTRLPETAEWMAGMLTDACSHQLRIPELPELIRRWTGTLPVRCACVESCGDTRAALAYELHREFGIDAAAIALAELLDADGRPLAPAALPKSIRDAHLLVTTAFHASEMRVLAAALGKPLLVATANPATLRAIDERLSSHDLTVVCTDPTFGERLRALHGGRQGERIRVLSCEDAEAIAALDGTEPVLLSLAARQRIAGASLRLVSPPYPSMSLDFARRVAETLIRLNVGAARA